MKFVPTLVAGMSLALSFSSVAFAQHYKQINLDSNVPGAAEATDTQLVNGWGLSRSSGSTWWVSDEATGFATLYDGPGTKQALVVKNNMHQIPGAIARERGVSTKVLQDGAVAIEYHYW